MQNYEDSVLDSNAPSEDTRVDESSKGLSWIDFRLADSLMKTQHVRRRSVDELSHEIDPVKNHGRSKTVPNVEDKEAIQLFKMFEMEKIKLKSHKLSQNQGIEVSEPHTPRQVSSTDESPFQIPDLVQFLEQANRVSKFAIGAYGTNMMKILGIGKAREFSHDWGDELHNHLTFALQ